MMITMILALALVDDRPFEADEQQYSAWLQQGCRLQQADRREGHEPAEFEAFCACVADSLNESSSDDAFRVMALSLQGHAQDRADISDWEAARDTAFAEYAALPQQEQSEIPGRLQSSLQQCVTLGPATND